jgi:hypothetical protein
MIPKVNGSPSRAKSQKGPTGSLKMESDVGSILTDRILLFTAGLFLRVL